MVPSPRPPFVSEPQQLRTADPEAMAQVEAEDTEICVHAAVSLVLVGVERVPEVTPFANTPPVFDPCAQNGGSSPPDYSALA